ncbi:MAG: hypothetical protein VB106_15615 [Clostridiaceae bacterium]|jgi:hypothetical protein|nr:hypothetical protein [Clostridiaceae bacterium]
MNTIFGQIKSKYSLNPGNISSRHNALAVFNDLTLKEKCLYLVKISKRSTSYQALALLALILSIIATNYLFSMIT